MQNYTVAPGDGATFDLISPVEGANALVNHSMRAALSGAIAVVMFSNKADPSMGHGDKILPADRQRAWNLLGAALAPRPQKEPRSPPK